MAISGVLNRLLQNTIANNKISKKKDTFQNNNNLQLNNQYEEPSYVQIMVILVMVILWLTLVLLVGKYLWNECLCKVLTICKPINSVYTLLGLIVLFDLLHPNM